jgi:hypothetical protein
MLTTGLRP